MNTRLAPVAFFVAGLLISYTASADTYKWSTTDPTYGLLAGQVTFTTVADPNLTDCGGSSCYFLQVALSNTTTQAVNQSSQVLNGLFFDIINSSTGQELTSNIGMATGYATGGLLKAAGTTPASGTGGTNSSICGDTPQGTALKPKCSSVDISKQGNVLGWTVGVDSSGLTIPNTGTTKYTQKYYLANGGWGDFHDTGNPNLGIVPSGGAPNPNNGMKSDFPLTYSTATFTLYGLTTDKISIRNVVASYGTAPEAEIAANSSLGPEPGTVVLVAGALVLLLTKKRRRA